MVARLEAADALVPGLVHDALLALPREVLMPQAYVRRNALDERPPRWDLLDWSEPGDREELLAVLYGGESVLIQHDGEPLVGRTGRARSGGSITYMSTVMSLTALLLQELDLRPGHRVLDIGAGAAVTAAVACHIGGDTGVVALDRNQHVAVAAQGRLGALGYRPAVVCGSGEDGWPERAPYDRIRAAHRSGTTPGRTPGVASARAAAVSCALSTMHGAEECNGRRVGIADTERAATGEGCSSAVVRRRSGRVWGTLCAVPGEQ
ncbi:protein-L-isoaspartate O-methyltransferase [Streptomyces lydicus]|uniref:protein-L-isoaspartate O-methyltransferase n=1 Tax=Streptomyces lydicus TaxID=47763 RepID=UPI0037D36762